MSDFHNNNSLVSVKKPLPFVYILSLDMNSCDATTELYVSRVDVIPLEGNNRATIGDILGYCMYPNLPSPF